MYQEIPIYMCKMWLLLELSLEARALCCKSSAISVKSQHIISRKNSTLLQFESRNYYHNEICSLDCRNHDCYYSQVKAARVIDIVMARKILCLKIPLHVVLDNDSATHHYLLIVFMARVINGI
jgi:hypothetical protein